MPWFVAKVGNGKYDFRAIDPQKLTDAIKKKRCWVCGGKLSPKKDFAFTIGPMCGVNRVTSEPPSHLDCATWSAKACPFLTQRLIHRRPTDDIEGGVVVDPAGIHFDQNPGVACIWVCRDYSTFNAPGGPGFLIDIGEPSEVLWYRKGGPASREDVERAIDAGYPRLLDLAKRDGAGAIAELRRRREALMQYLPE